MDKQSKLLDMEYLATRLRDFAAIKKKEFNFNIYPSDRAMSKTLYIEILKGNFKLTVLRISDHLIETKATQFIIEPYSYLTKKKKQQFAKCIENVIKSARRKSLYYKLNKLGEDNA